MQKTTAKTVKKLLSHSVQSSARASKAHSRMPKLQTSANHDLDSDAQAPPHGLAYIVQNGEQFVLVPVEEYERLMLADMAGEAVRQIEDVDDESHRVDADAFALDMAGAWIAEARKARKMTQIQLAKKLGIPQSQVSRIERCPDRTTVRTMRRIAKALGVDLRGLIRGQTANRTK